MRDQQGRALLSAAFQPCPPSSLSPFPPPKATPQELRRPPFPCYASPTCTILQELCVDG